MENVVISEQNITNRRNLWLAKVYDHSNTFLVRNNGSIVSRTSMACYSNLTYGGTLGPFKEFRTAFGKKCWNQRREEWADYMLTRSPFADMFITKSVEEAKKTGVSLDVSKPRVLLLGAAIALRFPFEVAGGSWTWQEFCELGLSELDAYVMAWQGIVTKDGNLGPNYSNSNHRIYRMGVSYQQYVDPCGTYKGSLKPMSESKCKSMLSMNNSFSYGKLYEVPFKRKLTKEMCEEFLAALGKGKS